MRKRIWLLLLLLSLLPVPVYGAEADLLAEMDRLETAAVDKAAAPLQAEVGFSAMLRDILTGAFDFSFSGWKEGLTEALFGELHLQGRLLLQLLIVVLLSAILRQLSDSFRGKSVGEMGFYLCYMVLIVVILDAFREISDVVVERMRGLNEVFTAMVPIFLTLVAAKGEVGSSALMGSAVIGGSAALSAAVERIIVPAVLLAVSLEMADHISEKPILGRFAKLLRQCISWGMKGAAMAFMLLLSLQKLGGGVLDGLAGKTAKIAVGSVPVVGDVMGGAVDMAAAAASALSSGTLAAAAIFLLLLCLPLLLKLAVIMLIFRVTAAAAEFICEERLVECIGAAGEYTGLLMGAVFLGEGMFLFSAVLLLGGL